MNYSISMKHLAFKQCDSNMELIKNKEGYKMFIFQKIQQILYQNRDMNTLISMAGKAPKKVPNRVALKIPKTK